MRSRIKISVRKSVKQAKRECVRVRVKTRIPCSTEAPSLRTFATEAPLFKR